MTMSSPPFFMVSSIFFSRKISNHTIRLGHCLGFRCIGGYIAIGDTNAILNPASVISSAHYMPPTRCKFIPTSEDSRIGTRVSTRLGSVVPTIASMASPVLRQSICSIDVGLRQRRWNCAGTAEYVQQQRGARWSASEIERVCTCCLRN